jgi:hypothetical protein
MIKTRISAIMQPTYLPWSGYFGLIGSVSNFVFLDDVQISIPSWQNRNRIMGQSGPYYLTLPANLKFASSKIIRDIPLINEESIKQKHIEAIRHSYRKAPFYEEVFFILQEVYSRDHSYLSNFTIDLIRTFSAVLGYDTIFHRSSEITAQGSRSEKLVGILRYLNSDCYYSPSGSREYIEEDAIFSRENIPVYFQNFVPEPYAQLAPGFTPYLSAIDSFFCIGFEETKLIISRNQSFVN